MAPLDVSRGYTEWPVHPALASVVVCTWRDAPHEQRQPVLPDACIDLVWDGETLMVAGPDTSAVPITGDDTFVGIRFRPGAAPAFLGVPASELVDQRPLLSELWGRTAGELAERLMDRPNDAAQLLEAAVFERLSNAEATDRVVDGVVTMLGRIDSEPLAVSTVAADLGVSERTLRRRCTEALGYGPKTLERILRFRHALRLLRHQYSLAHVAWLAGYADQAHLTNEFRRLANATPATLAASQLSISANGCD